MPETTILILIASGLVVLVLAAFALGIGTGILLTVVSGRRTLDSVLRHAGMVSQPGTTHTDVEPEDRVRELLENVVDKAEVDTMTDQVLSIAQDSGMNMSREQAREEAERILFAGSLFGT